jgi:hypothetical protein
MYFSRSNRPIAMELCPVGFLGYILHSLELTKGYMVKLRTDRALGVLSLPASGKLYVLGPFSSSLTHSELPVRTLPSHLSHSLV